LGFFYKTCFGVVLEKENFFVLSTVREL